MHTARIFMLPAFASAGLAHCLARVMDLPLMKGTPQDLAADLPVRVGNSL